MDKETVDEGFEEISLTSNSMLFTTMLYYLPRGGYGKQVRYINIIKNNKITCENVCLCLTQRRVTVTVYSLPFARKKQEMIHY